MIGSDLNDVRVNKELKSDITLNQSILKKAFEDHQDLILQIRDDKNNADLRNKLREVEEKIVEIGLLQKSLVNKLRDECHLYDISQKTVCLKNGIEDKKSTVANSLTRARKQNIVARSASVTSFSDDSTGYQSAHSSPEHGNPVGPHEISQSKFLAYFQLGTHVVCKEMQNKRAERKRRSTANPQFLYGGSKGWDFLGGGKRPKRGAAYLASNISPPNTRQSSRRKNERTSPPPNNNNVSNASGNGVPAADVNTNVYAPFPRLPTLPSGLTIERVVSPTGSSPDSRSCITCRQPGLLTVCEICSNGFHISCHNRPLAQTPRRCPYCINIKDAHITVGSLNVPAGMSVSCVNGNAISEKLEEKRMLEEKNQNLTAELTQLQDRHSQLTISLKNQKTQQEEILKTQQSTEDKIKQILNFINSVRNPTPEKA